MGFLAGKRVLIVGVASKLSIASGIAAAMHREGAELAFTYQNDKLKGRVEDFAAGWGSNAELCFPCDVASDSEITAVFDALSQKWDGLDIIVHSVGFAPGDQLNGDFTEVTTRDGFRIADTAQFVRVAQGAGLAVEERITQVIDPPSFDLMGEMIDQITRDMGQ